MRAAYTTAWGLAVLAGAVGCTSAGHPAPAAAATTATAPAAAARPAASAAPVEADPGRPLSLPERQKALVRVQGGRGSERVADVTRIRRGTLGVAVACDGPGAVVVHLGAVADVTAECGAGPGVYDEIALDGAKARVAVSVTAAVANEWALTVGWTPAVAKPRS
ncbi:hypothetical protein [Streptomyces sp. NPDC020917]|uniref:hypothetical protein n=1 Tax=Streptomyces sp. NPDC020917 TaxID=3365102 RepID=UPI0037A9CF3B